jgi:hypothetical protein
VEQLSRCGSGEPSIDRERGRESPTGRRCVATRVGKDISTGWCAESREGVAHVLESARPEIRARGEKSVTEEMFSPRLSSRNVRSLRKDLHGVWKDCRGGRVDMEEKVVFGNYGSWGAEDWYKGLAPARCRDFSPQLT